MAIKQTETRLFVPAMNPLQGGSFVMGSERGRSDEQPSHVVILQPFMAGVRSVSNSQYAIFLAATGHEAPSFWRQPGFDEPGQPVVAVNWFDATAYCDWLATQTGIPFRLPTEAEREFAARGGIMDADWPWGASADFDPILEQLAQPHEPRTRCANAFGLYCMADNVHEWCSDWYDPQYYSISPSEAPIGPTGSTQRRASRGGSWRHKVKFNKVSARSSLNPEFRYNDYGFRVYSDV